MRGDVTALKNVEPQDRGRILLVEDEEDFAHAIRIMLNRVGYSLEWASTMAQASTMLDERIWDLVLLDLTLPDAQGSETITRVQQHQPECPVVVLTGHNDAEFAVQSLRRGAANYLTKLNMGNGPMKTTTVTAMVSRFSKGVVVARSTSPASPWARTL